MRLRCPHCHAEYGIEAAVEDDAARELQGLLADLPRETSRPLVHYLGLFRSRTRALAWERAVRLAREALALHQDMALLGQAMSETVEAIRKKQQSSAWPPPLKNHHYLKRVIEGVAERYVPAAAEREGGGPQPSGRQSQALTRLEERRRGR